jgi:mRNA interferase RelE/StbE
MTEYNVEFVESAAKEFRDLTPDMKYRIGLAIRELRNNPRLIGVRKLKGHDCLYRIRVGHYRVIYEIDDQAKMVLVTRIRRREKAYQ